VIVVIGALVFVLSRKRRSVGLRRRFGSEYDRALETRASRHAAENDLRNRSKRRASIDLHR